MGAFGCEHTVREIVLSDAVSAVALQRDLETNLLRLNLALVCASTEGIGPEIKQKDMNG